MIQDPERAREFEFDMRIMGAKQKADRVVSNNFFESSERAVALKSFQRELSAAEQEFMNAIVVLKEAAKIFLEALANRGTDDQFEPEVKKFEDALTVFTEVRKTRSVSE